MMRFTYQARIIHEGSLRKRADAKRDGYSEVWSPEAYSCSMLKGWTARLPVTAAYPRLQQKLH